MPAIHRFLIYEVYLEAFFFLTGLRAEEEGFFFDLADIARVADKATDRSAFSAILFNQASISEFSSGVAIETVAFLTLLRNLKVGNPLLCNPFANLFVAGVTFTKITFKTFQTFSSSCCDKKI
jgi:hypothetical protein